jgi:ribose transport system substrate-binding protein
MKKIMIFVSALFLLASVITGCGSTTTNTSDSQTSAQQQGASEEGEDKIKIGLSLANMADNPFYVSVKDGAEKKAQELNVDLEVTDSQGNSQKQFQDIESFVQKKVDVLIINAVDSSSIVPALKDAADAGIMIMTEDVKVPDADEFATSHVGIDNFEAGKEIAKWMADTLTAQGKGKVVIIDYAGLAESANSRSKGYRDVLQNYKGITIVDDQATGPTREDGLKLMDDMLIKHKEIDGVVAINDQTAIGALSSISGAGKNGILVTGFDGTEDGLNEIKNGSMAALIDSQPYSMGELSIQTAVKIAKGEKVDKMTPVDVKLVTKDNVDEIIEKHESEK